MNGADREGLDLHHRMCRQYFWKQFKEGKWRYLWWWEVVWTDTRFRVCSR